MSDEGAVFAPLDHRIHLDRGGIEPEHARRQSLTAQAILERLALRPGVVLADEVGMGKTFVALAVAASAAYSNNSPVVVMVPPGLITKWERDLCRFRARCLSAEVATEEKDRLRYRTARTGVELLKCFDDPPERRVHVVLLVNTALHRAERDPFIRLAAIRKAIHGKWGVKDLRRAVARFACELLRSSTLQNLREEEIEDILELPSEAWLDYFHRLRCWDSTFKMEMDDDPVPRAFLEVLEGADLSALASCLERIPRRESKHIDERLKDVKAELNGVLHAVWNSVFHKTNILSPLLIFDEAHHLKNPSTRLAQCFLEESRDGASVISGAFKRMLFLTATPFQLGHTELLEVLKRFLAIRWSSLPLGRDVAVKEELSRLGVVLDRAQMESLQLDRIWGTLKPEDVPQREPDDTEGSWWLRVVGQKPDHGILGRVLVQYEKARKVLAEAQELLLPWVIRHRRPAEIRSETTTVCRRQEHRGRAIQDGVTHHRGIEIQPRARFPFLLCARAQSILARAGKQRAYFAEGLASSFPAFLETSRGGRPVDDTDSSLECATADSDLGWYVRHVEEFLRAEQHLHPKVEATVRKALDLWLAGEKVLIFGHFRHTIRDLAAKLHAGVEQEISRLAAKALRLPHAETAEALRRVDRIVQRLQDRESPLRRRVQEILGHWVEDREGLTAGEREQIVQLLLGALATPSFVVNHFPLDREEVRASLEDDRASAAQARDAANAVADSLARRKGAGLAYRARVQHFLDHLLEYFSSASEREQTLGELLAADKDVVRHASGEVRDETRRRVVLGFNSPLLPQILVASEVMSEGLDLHLDCRHVIHHDLSWNPSTLEQRTGRVDRLRCLTEVEGQPIQVYLPYLEGTADEKMYRVVSDRARWFQVVMGEKYQVDERSTDRLEARVPFPAEAAAGLAFDLSVMRNERDQG